MSYTLTHIRQNIEEPEYLAIGVTSPFYELTSIALGVALDYEGDGEPDISRAEFLVAVGHKLLVLSEKQNARLYAAIDRDGKFNRVALILGGGGPVNDSLGEGETMRPMTLAELASMHGEAMLISLACTDFLDADDAEDRHHYLSQIGVEDAVDITDRKVCGAMALWKIDQGYESMDAGYFNEASWHFAVAGSLVGMAEFQRGYDVSPRHDVTLSAANPRAIGRLGGKAKSERLAPVRAHVASEFSRWPADRSIAEFIRQCKGDVLAMSNDLGAPLSPMNIERQIGEWVRVIRGHTPGGKRSTPTGLT